MAPIKRSTSITGRDNYIRNQALLYAIAHIQSLPEHMQEFSNMCDMCNLVIADQNIFTPKHLWDVERHTGVVPNLWPLPLDSYSAEQLELKEQWEAAHEYFRVSFTAFRVFQGLETSDDERVVEFVKAMKEHRANQNGEAA